MLGFCGGAASRLSAAAPFEWQIKEEGPCQLVVPDEAALRFPEGFKATVKFACDLDKIGERSNHANLFTKGKDFHDGYSVMVRKDGALLVDIKGIEPDYYVFPAGFESMREYLLEIYVTPEFVRNVLAEHPDARIYALRLDRGLSPPKVLGTVPGTHWAEERWLDEHQYIVPGAGGVVFDDSADMLRQARFANELAAIESCGKCTPCREGTYWLERVMNNVYHGRGTEKDIALLESVAKNMQGKCLCALGEFATSPILSTIRHFLDEYKAKVRSRPASADAEMEAAPQAAALAG